MERRLVPVNALIAMCTPGDVYPSPFADAGYRLAGIEVPVATDGRSVVIDAVLFRADRNIILAGEAKSGANVESEQAHRYDSLDADSVVTAAAITIPTAGPREVQPVYVCLAASVDRIRKGLDDADVEVPIVAIDELAITRHGCSFIDSDLEAGFARALEAPGWPPRLVPVDDTSPDEDFDRLVVPALVATLSRRRPEISVPALAEQALRHLPMFGKQARGRLVTKVDLAARRAAQRDPTTFEYMGRTGVREHGVVRFLLSPEEAARQGRTQVYQGIARRGGKPTRRQAVSDDQMALFELVDGSQEAMLPSDNTDAAEEEGQ